MLFISFSNAFVVLSVLCCLNRLNSSSGSAVCFTKESLHQVENGGFHCQHTKFKPSVKKDLLGGHCHTQGVGIWNESSPLIITCQDLAKDAQHHQGKVLSFKGQDWSVAVDSAEFFVPPRGNHPSATQVWENIFPVGYSQDHDSGPTTVFFYKILSNASFETLPIVLNHPQGHLGAFAFANIHGKHHLIGCGWNCDHMAFWVQHDGDSESHANGSFPNMSKYLFTDTASLMDDSGVDTHVGSYNSMFLCTYCSMEDPSSIENDPTPLLFATHAYWMDVFEVLNLGTDQVRLRKIIKRKVPYMPTWGFRPIFLEGVTFIPNPQDGRAMPTLLATPHDFGSFDCPSKDMECMQRVYSCVFGQESQDQIGIQRRSSKKSVSMVYEFAHSPLD